MKLFLFSILLSTQLFAAENKTPPLREVAVIVTKEGYYPKSLSVFEGEKVKFYVTSTVEEPHCLIVESHKVFLAANKGKVTEAEAVFDKAGEFAFYCPSSKNDGKIVVLKKVVPKREVASEKGDGMLWTPKEY
ncbi:cupredoxin domain-containing protein [Peredibacter starrii]|uniref:Cupredoxin domain-containing protein n=1 Tax=Peredibacter starrii TaxID=28202 RepID=A0AAX4HT20_9BACT|nr:cupredoxin domain-containing protein [Peredibacter starrii]WPU66335.1 cupredoxin domain-containing protein [Peredibacter starrii]